MENSGTALFGIFTQSARIVLRTAQDEAQRRGHSEIDPEHMLLALLSNPEYGAVAVIRASGISPGSVYTAAEAAIQPGEPTIFGLSPRTKRVIELAVVEMKNVRSPLIDTEQLLLGVLREEQESKRDLLSRLGVSLTAARSEVERMQYARSLPQPPGTVQLDSNRQQQAVTLARTVQRARLIYTLVIAIVTAAIVIFVLQSASASAQISTLVNALATVPVLNWQPVAGWSPLLLLLYFLLISIPLLALSVPLSWYLTYVIPHRYGLRKGSARKWLRELGSGLLLLGTLAVLLSELIALLIAVSPRTWWIEAALIQFLYSVLSSRFGSLRLRTHAKDIVPLSEGEIAARFQALIARLHLPSCGLYRFNISQRTSRANAFFTGWGKGRRVLLTDTMLQSFPPDEIEVILAHELGHLVHHDIWTRLVMRGLTMLGLFYLFSLYLSGLNAPNANSDASVSSLLFQDLFPLLVLCLVLAFMIFTSRYRRHQEYRADEFALQTTGKVQSFKDAMIRLTNMGMLVAVSTRRARHPASHPVLLKRLQHADEFAARHKLFTEAG